MRALICTSLVGLLWATVAPAQSPIPAAPLVRGTLSFDGHATLGDFVGTTDSVRGEMTGGAGLAAVRGWVEGRGATLTSGNGKGDQGLRKAMGVHHVPTNTCRPADRAPGAA